MSALPLGERPRTHGTPAAGTVPGPPARTLHICRLLRPPAQAHHVYPLFDPHPRPMTVARPHQVTQPTLHIIKSLSLITPFQSPSSGRLLKCDLLQFPLAPNSTVLQLLLLPLVPESPRYLLVKGKTAAAEAALARVLRVCGKDMPEGSLKPLKHEAPKPKPDAPREPRPAARVLQGVVSALEGSGPAAAFTDGPGPCLQGVGGSVPPGLGHSIGGCRYRVGI